MKSSLKIEKSLDYLRDFLVEHGVGSCHVSLGCQCRRCAGVLAVEDGSPAIRRFRGTHPDMCFGEGACGKEVALNREADYKEGADAYVSGQRS